MKRTAGKTKSLIGISAVALAAQSLWITPISFADEGIFSAPRLGGSNFGSILPKGPFQNYQMDSAEPESSPDAPMSLYEKTPQAPAYSESLSEQLNRSGATTSAPVEQSTAPVSKTNAWYKFLDPSLNLTRTLEESERKNILPIVPIPPSISKPAKGAEYVHTVILKADSKPDYGAFKTGFGSLFGRSGSIIMVSNTARSTRIFNVNGYERDVLFKLPNGQIIAVGPGSEMMISKNLNANELNAHDGIARRGFTRTMRCSELSMAFAQYSLPSLLEVPEFRFFQKNQDQKVTASLQKTADALDSMRGNEGFHKVLSLEEQQIRRQKAKEAEARPIPPNRVSNASVIAQAAKPNISSASAATGASKARTLSTAEKNAQQLKQAAVEKLAAEKKIAERKLAEKKIAEKNGEKIAAAEKLAAAKKAQTDKQNLMSRFSLKGLRGNDEKTSSELVQKAEKTEKTKLQKNNTKEPSKVALLSARSKKTEAENQETIVPANLPADTRELLLLAEKNEKQAKDLRIKAAKNKDFSEAYYLSAEQRLHLYKTFRKQMKKATELDQIAREARDKAAIAGNTNHSTQ